MSDRFAIEPLYLEVKEETKPWKVQYYSAEQLDRLPYVQFVDWIRNENGKSGMKIQYRRSIGAKWLEKELLWRSPFTFEYDFVENVYQYESDDNDYYLKSAKAVFRRNVNLKVVEYAPPFLIKDLNAKPPRYLSTAELGKIGMEFICWICDAERNIVGMKVLENRGSCYEHPQKYDEEDLFPGKIYSFFTDYTFVTGPSDWEDDGTGHKFCLITPEEAAAELQDENAKDKSPADLL